MYYNRQVFFKTLTMVLSKTNYEHILLLSKPTSSKFMGEALNNLKLYILKFDFNAFGTIILKSKSPNYMLLI